MKPEQPQYTTARLLNVLQSTQGIRMQRLPGFDTFHPALQEWLSSRRREIIHADFADILGISKGTMTVFFQERTMPREMKGFLDRVTGMCNLSAVEEVVFTATLEEDLLRRKGLWPVIMTPEKGISAALGRRVTPEEYQTMRRDFFAHGVITTL